MIDQTSTRGQRGQALILIALAAVGLFAFSALAIDGSRAFSNKRHAQNAADTAVLAAALAQIRTPGDENVKFAAAVAAAEDRAESNGFVHNGSSIIVEIYRCDNPATTCTGLPTGADPTEYIQVKIVSTIPTTFGRVIGRQTLTSAVEAIARVQGDAAPSTGTSLDGAAMVSTKDSSDDQCFLLNGNANLETHNSGIFVNCSGDGAFFDNGASTFKMGADSRVVGCREGNGGTITGGNINCNANKMVIDASTYAGVPTMPVPPAPSDCSGIGLGSKIDNGDGTFTLTPGKFTELVITKPTTMQDGIYCTTGSFNVQEQGSLTGTGNVRIVLPNSGFDVGSNKIFNFESLEVFTVNDEIKVQGTLTANRLRFYSSGSSNLIITAQSTLISPNTYFYLHRGAIRLNGGTNVNLSAPPAGDPYVGGVLLHMPWENTSESKLNGGSFVKITGTFLMPHSKVTFNGGNVFELHTQIIAYEYKINGGGKVDIYYLANNIVNPPNISNPTIELTK